MDVLLVEDDRFALRSQQLILQGCGTKVRAAQTAAQALSLCDLHEFDLIFMDIGLPDNSGIECAQAIQSSKLNANTAIVALTGFLDQALHQQCLQVGMFDVIVKPITGQLYKKITEDFNRARKSG